MKIGLALPFVLPFFTPRTTVARAQPKLTVRGSRIVGGSKATPGQFPFFTQGQGCGGSLVAPDVVLTAAHCKQAFFNSVLVGAHLQNEPSVGNAQWRKIQSMHVHPDYNGRDMKHDLMVVKILGVTKENLKPIELNFDDAYPGDGQELRVIGMGARSEDDFGNSEELLYVDVNVVNSEKCVNKYKNKGGRVYPKFMMCAGVSSGMPKDSCYGDSGGPIFDMSTPPKQVAVVSWGKGCARKEYPGVYARLSADKEWLTKKICSLSSSSSELAMCDGISSSSGSGTGSGTGTGGNACTKKGKRCSKSKSAPNCCGGKNFVCSKVRNNDPFPRCLSCRKNGFKCGPGKPPCCGRCVRKKKNGRFISKCRS